MEYHGDHIDMDPRERSSVEEDWNKLTQKIIGDARSYAMEF